MVTRIKIRRKELNYTIRFVGEILIHKCSSFPQFFNTATCIGVMARRETMRNDHLSFKSCLEIQGGTCEKSVIKFSDYAIVSKGRRGKYWI